MRKRSKALAVAMCALVLALGVNATIAWLTDKADPVTNTFTVGDINIDLGESEDLDLKMVPGNTIIKDPTVTVTANSEDCWLFVKIEESANFDDYMAYDYAEGWRIWLSEHDSADGKKEAILYRSVETAESDQKLGVIADNKVSVLPTVTKDMMDAISGNMATGPTLTFTACAVQKDNLTANQAWEEAVKAMA